MANCKRCGSYAVNPHCHGREPAVDLDLCDVCYWRKRAERQPTLFEQSKEDARRQRAAKALYDETMSTP